MSGFTYAKLKGAPNWALLLTPSKAALTKAKATLLDGTGYPHGLAGEAIPLSGCIAAIGDVFDALTSPHPYKRAWTVDEALALIEENRGKHFDPAVVEAFFKVLPEILNVREDYRDRNSAT